MVGFRSGQIGQIVLRRVLEAQEYALGTVIIHFQNLVGKTAWEAERSFKVATKKYDAKVEIINLIILSIAKISFFDSFVL